MQKELESLQDYLQLEHLRFGDKFDYQIDLDETIEAETLNVAPGMVQPFIENAIWHGVRGLESRKGFVRVAFQPGKLVGSVRCIIEDDGIGRKLSEERKSNLPGKKSRGISIIIERLTIINNMRKTNFKMMVEDHFPDRKETGTRITIDIPLKQG
jgi:LytS/YehU family sensor histidine kinase